MAVFIRIDEAEDHMPEVSEITRQRRHPVVVADRVRVSAQVAEVLERHKRPDKELVIDRLALHYLSQDPGARLRAGSQGINQRLFV
jgi:hypothetical protein